MGKFIDRQILNILIGSLTFVTLKLMKISTIYCVLLSAIIYSILLIISIINKVKKTTKLSYRDFIIYSILSGEKYLKNKIFEIIDKNLIIDCENYFIYNNKAYFIILKFASLSYDNLLSIYNQCKKNNIKNVVIISQAKDRKILNLSKYLFDFNIELMSLYPIYKKLKMKKLLPIFNKNYNFSYSLQNVLDSILKKANIKTFIFAFIITFILSYFTILKTYYIIFSIFNLTLALISIVYNLRNKTKDLL